MSTEAARGSGQAAMFRELFLQEEFRGDRLVNTVRFFILFVLLALAAFKAGFPAHLEADTSFLATMGIIGFGYLYTVAGFLLYRKAIYHPAMKYASITLDVTLAVLSVAVYKLEPYAEYGQIYVLARASIIYWFIIWSLLRYNVWLSIYAGVLGGVEYLLFVVLGNDMTGTVFSFTGKDGLSHTSEFASAEALLKVVYLIIAGGLAAVAAWRMRALVTTSIMREHEKGELQAKNRIVETVNRENRKYLDNISQGLLLIDRAYVISEQYSAFLVSLFGTDRIAGRGFVDFIYPDAAAQEVERGELARFLAIVFTNTTASPAMIRDVNPLLNRTIRVRESSGKTVEKVIDATFHRVLEGDRVENVMVIFEDRTAIARAERELESEKRAHESELETISVILKTGHASLGDFIEESRAGLKTVLQSLPLLRERETLHRAFRETHSLKGSAAMLGFKRIVEHAHAAESLLADIRDGAAPADETVRQQVEAAVKVIFADFDAIQKLFRGFTDFSRRDQGEREAGAKSPLDQFLGSLREMAAELSGQLEKDVVFHVQNSAGELPFLSRIKNPLIHLVRNAIDHGIEDRFERLAKGKPREGNIRLTLARSEDSFVIDVADDGSGIDFEKVRRKAVEKNLLDPNAEISDKALVSMLFLPGFSSRDEVTEISGRGVGLDVVKESVAALGGKIAVSVQKDRGTRVTLRVPG